MNIEKTKHIKYLLLRCQSLKENMIRTLNDTSSIESGRYSSFKTYAEEHSYLACEIGKFLELSNKRILYYNTEKMKSWADTL